MAYICGYNFIGQHFFFIYSFINSNKTLFIHNQFSTLIDPIHLNDKLFEANVGDFLSSQSPANIPLMKINFQ